MGHMRLVEDNRDMVCLEGELVKFCIVAGLSYPAAPFPFPVGTDLLDKHVHFMDALILSVVLEGDRHLQGAAAGTAAGWCRIAGLFGPPVFE